jgi:hypothetical protein
MKIENTDEFFDASADSPKTFGAPNDDNRSTVIIAIGMAAISGAAIGFALALLFGSAAHAQSAQPPMPTLSQLLKLRESIPGKKPLVQPKSILPNGWNYRVCTESFMYTNGTSAGMFITNTDQSGIEIGFSRQAPSLETAIQADFIAACQHAPRGYWVHITDATRVSFDAILIDYP